MLCHAALSIKMATDSLTNSSDICLRKKDITSESARGYMRDSRRPSAGDKAAKA